MMNVVVLDQREHSAEMAHDAGLAAVMDLTASDDMRADPLLCPSLALRQFGLVAGEPGGSGSVVL